MHASVRAIQLTNLAASATRDQIHKSCSILGNKFEDNRVAAEDSERGELHFMLEEG